PGLGADRRRAAPAAGPTIGPAWPTTEGGHAMGHAMAAWLHAAALTALRHVREDRRGQGTVEYVGVVVMVTLLIAAVAVAAKGWAPSVGGELKKAVEAAIKKASGGL